MNLIERKIANKALSFVCILAILVSVLAIYAVPASALDLETPMVLSRSSDKAAVVVKQQFTVDYKIQPQTVTAAEVVPPTKDFYLVIDTSGSMKNALDKSTRLQVAKDAAKNFMDTLDGKTNVRAGLIVYDNNATKAIGLTSNMAAVKSAIDGLYAEGGTNLGDGLRVAYYELLNNSTAAEKYIVLLTDGEPTYHSYTSNSEYKMNSGYTTKHRGGGSKITEEDKQYAYKVAEELVKKDGIKSFMIAFTSGSNQSVLQEIAKKAGGTYKLATDGKALNDVYKNISDELINDFSLQNVSFEETIPDGLSIAAAQEGFTISGQKVSGSLPAIQYHLNKTTMKYSASPIEFSVTYNADVVGNYILGSGDSSKMMYKDTSGNIQTLPFEPLSIQVKDANASIELSRNLTMSQIKAGQQTTINFKINPLPISMGSAEVIEKEIVLVFDTSTSMEKSLDGDDVKNGEQTREQIAKAQAVEFVNSLAGKQGISVALVSFSNKAEVSNELTTNMDTIKSAINALPTISGTNIGDGLRRAHYILNSGSATAEKYIILLTDGEPWHYSKNPDSSYYLGAQAAPGTASSDTKAAEYCTKVVNELIKGKGYDNYFIAFSTKNNVLETLAPTVGGHYEEALTGEALGEVYSGISEDITGDFYVNDIQFSEELPANITAVDASEGITFSGQTISGTIGKITYKYDEATGKHKAAPKEFSVTITAGNPGNYTLGADNKSALTYTDINEDSVTKYFQELSLSVLEDPDPPYEPDDEDDPKHENGEPGFETVGYRKAGEEAIVQVEITLPDNITSWALLNPDEATEGTPDDGLSPENTPAYLINPTTMEIDGLNIYTTYNAVLWYKLDDGTEGRIGPKPLYVKIDVN